MTTRPNTGYASGCSIGGSSSIDSPLSGDAIPAHHLAAPRPAPISFEAARAEAQRHCISDGDDSGDVGATHGANARADAQPGEPLVAAVQAPQKTEAA